MLTEENKEFYNSYFQENADYYLNQMRKFDTGGNCSFNIPAFFLGLLWMAYRKMYKHILIIVGLIFIEIFIEELLFQFDIISIGVYQVIDMISNFAWWIIIGFFANRFYILKSQQDVAKIMGTYSDKEQRIHFITKKGGTSLIGPIGFLLIIALIIFIEV